MLMMGNQEDSVRGKMERYVSKVDRVLWSLVINVDGVVGGNAYDDNDKVAVTLAT